MRVVHVCVSYYGHDHRLQCPVISNETLADTVTVRSSCWKQETHRVAFQHRWKTQGVWQSDDVWQAVSAEVQDWEVVAVLFVNSEDCIQPYCSEMTGNMDGWTEVSGINIFTGTQKIFKVAMSSILMQWYLLSPCACSFIILMNALVKKMTQTEEKGNPSPPARYSKRLTIEAAVQGAKPLTHPCTDGKAIGCAARGHLVTDSVGDRDRTGITTATCPTCWSTAAPEHITVSTFHHAAGHFYKDIGHCQT